MVKDYKCSFTIGTRVIISEEYLGGSCCEGTGIVTGYYSVNRNVVRVNSKCTSYISGFRDSYVPTKALRLDTSE